MIHLLADLETHMGENHSKRGKEKSRSNSTEVEGSRRQSNVSPIRGNRGKDDEISYENTGSWCANLKKKTRHSDSYAHEKKYRKKDNQLGKKTKILIISALNSTEES